MVVRLFVLVIFNFKNAKKIFSSSPLLLLLLLTSCQGTPPTNLGVHDNKLRPCPDKPNCVVSYDFGEQKNFIEPIKSEEEPGRIKEKILGIVSKDKSAKIVEQNDTYLRAEYTSNLFKFVDDVEFWFGETGVVHFRSASRLGYSDLGANKDRIETIRFKFHQNDF
ncbi:MAG: hypothetical protein COW01_10640 [Bdellovibrionales bacterium CG12_big_fil_rev_8_21_14_0_65_38_15]|nr:MAG: hypothetical protein COW79_07485 [Bdellovibrionales bacterium CG22_combo_CG10-13_8_21_14_all_38_13]PIQ54594.1 MAG: hypothetical protein COW01_10640 [Bdellovibrionales bacterium CG12_big_fil_rev_8_21_14_0_65_38_15]PIR29975.1 MAG: hypothetical protein COV38_08485 [Bdellovibrionales bacterium CG11_big_fil_rev_8_21_14_0_20_38_13]